jgi:hypothetical protein
MRGMRDSFPPQSPVSLKIHSQQTSGKTFTMREATSYARMIKLARAACPQGQLIAVGIIPVSGRLA